MAKIYNDDRLLFSDSGLRMADMEAVEILHVMYINAQMLDIIRL